MSTSSIPFISLTPNSSKLLLKPSTCTPRLRLSSSSFSLGSFSKRGFRNGGLTIKGCSTSPFIGRVGSQRREGNSSLLSFGINPPTAMSKGAEQSGEDSSQVLSAMLPFVVAATAIAALAQPATFTWVSKDLYAPALGGIMLSIGIKLSVDDFALAVKSYVLILHCVYILLIVIIPICLPLPLSIGFIAQYVLKPALGVLIAMAFGVPRIFYAGFVLTTCVAGAQLSSYASFLSKGDVALSILLTSSTTIASVIVTPILTGLLIGSVVPVNAVAMAKSILQVVLVPVTIGLALNTYAKPVVTILQPVMPFVAMICTSLCIGSPLAINQRQILSMDGLRLIFPVLAFHAVAFAVGYWVSKIPSVRQEEEVSRTLSLCTGMQSSTLAGLLASQFLGSSQAVPPACSVVAMAIMGLFLASFWGTGARIRDLSSLLMPQTSSTMNAS